MTNIDLIEQLNNEIENVELPKKVLENLLLEMQRQKIQEKKAVKHSRFKMTARLRNSLAVCSVALLMVVAIPVITGANETPKTPKATPPAIVSYQRLLPNVVEYTDVDTLVETNVALPMNFAKAHANTTTIFETNGAVSLVKQQYILAEEAQVTIDIDFSNENQKTDKNATSYNYKHIELALVNQAKDGGCLKFAFNKSIYFISFQNIKDNGVLTEIIDDILIDK